MGDYEHGCVVFSDCVSPKLSFSLEIVFIGNVIITIIVPGYRSKLLTSIVTKLWLKLGQHSIKKTLKCART